MTIQCAGCSAEWTGLAVAHCGGCHETFASVGSFDRHRKTYRCLPPGDCGLSIGARGFWTRADQPELNAA